MSEEGQVYIAAIVGAAHRTCRDARHFLDLMDQPCEAEDEEALKARGAALGRLYAGARMLVHLDDNDPWQREGDE